MSADSAFLSGVLRLQVRHGHVGGHRLGRPGADRRRLAAEAATTTCGFLAGGCSKDPLDLLRDAGVDMEQPAAIDAALSRFGELVDELDRLL